MTTPLRCCREVGLLFVGFLCCGVAAGQPVLSEISATGSTAIVDEDVEMSDWIEISNSTETPLDLSGYFLTDEPDNLPKWKFPDGTSIGGSGYLVVFASGKDRRNVGEELHTNFRLSASGEYLALIEPDGTTPAHAFSPMYPAQLDGATFGIGIASELNSTTFVPPGAPVRWKVPTDDGPVVDWPMTAFDDSGWMPARSGIGYDYDELIGDGGDTRDAMRVVNASVYVRVPFELANPAAVVSMTLRIKFEDGFVAYLNGEKVASANAPATPLWNSTSTGVHSDADAVLSEDFSIDFAGKLTTGTNLLAFHGLNNSRGGADFLLLPELIAEVVDLTMPASTGYFEEPSSGRPNAPLSFSGIVADTKFGIDRGFYDEPFKVEIVTETPGAQIYFTTDGTTPSDVNGDLYSGPINITTTTTLRATAIADGMRPSNTDTQSYIFLGDVIRQPSRPVGAPTRWGSRTSSIFILSTTRGLRVITSKNSPAPSSCSRALRHRRSRRPLLTTTATSAAGGSIPPIHRPWCSAAVRSAPRQPPLPCR
jgi:hypothetical protein